MLRALAPALAVLQCCVICGTIRVPTVWDSNSEVLHSFDEEEPKTSADKIEPQNLQQPVPVEYFQYTANKPQFAVDIAKFHGVPSPEEHFKARPVRPYTGKESPELGKHRIQEQKRPVFQEFQHYIKKDENFKLPVKPTTTTFEVFHPYKAEEPGFQELYKDPVLDKIRNDIRDSSQRLQTYEHEAGKPNIESGEYLESIEETDRKKFPHKNIPAPYEIHRPQRRPIYYQPSPRYPSRDHVLNQRFKHPWNQNYVKIRPVHYVPLHNHIHRLRQNHALKYDDEHNEYPQVPIQHYEEPSDGYDIYEKGKAKFVQLRNNLDESVNDIIKESRPSAPQKLELQSDEESEPEEEDEFIPVKNYAQVRKFETTKHLPKSAAFDEAENYEEILNAPRLREAIKSTKAQTVYTEEGYEDSAYDHAGEQKHASDHEGHGGYLKENELSAGKYKTPSVSGTYEDSNGSAYKDKIIHGKKWKDNNRDSQKEEDSEDYDEDEHEKYIEADSYQHGPKSKEDIQRNKRQDNFENDEKSEDIEESKEIGDSENIDESKNKDTNILSSQHDVSKRETSDFKVPQINFDSVYLNEKDILEISKKKPIAKDNLKEKYPYYFKNYKAISKHSPLRYAENLKLIPKKSSGGTEFYDSRSHLECPEVDDKVDAIPEKLKKNGHPDEGTEDDEQEKTPKNKNLKGDPAETARLTGLGDKIDCFKAKYFGENPLDSPFFKEELISNPESLTVPSLTLFKFQNNNGKLLLNSSSDAINDAEKLRNSSHSDIFELLEKLNNNQYKLVDSLIKGSEELNTYLKPQNSTVNTRQTGIYNDILQNIKNNDYRSVLNNSQAFNQSLDKKTGSETFTRKKRAVPFVYEPYKIIRNVQVPDSKKTTTTSNISPLIKQLQSSKVIEPAVKDQHVKRTPITYKDIGRKERERSSQSNIAESGFINVNVDKRKSEPRYELKLPNHKSEYSPINNIKSMSVEDYEAQTKQKSISDTNENKKAENILTKQTESESPKVRAVYDISRFLPKHEHEETQNHAASNTVKTTVAASSPPTTVKGEELSSDEDSDESDEEYDDDYEEENLATSTTTTTTTTLRPIFRRKIRSTTTTEREEIVTEQPPKLRLITRFNHPSTSEKRKENAVNSQKTTKKYTESDEAPKYREKKKKTTKSTLVTDTKKYGNDDDDDMKKEEIDALIGVKHDMEEYMPTYEKETEVENNRKETDSSEEDISEEDDNNDAESENEDEDDDEDYSDEDEEEKDTVTQKAVVSTITEIPRRTLVRTTDAPPSTTESRSAKLVMKPVVTRKKIEIHKELPVNKSSPHLTQYKQDIKEVEIIKELPGKPLEKKKQKNLELLDFYKDENLAKDINQLGGVEIFKEDLDVKNGPRHGGNYRRAPDFTEKPETTTVQMIRRRIKKPPKDTVTSQTENKKHVELDEDYDDDDNLPARRLHGGNLRSVSDIRHRGTGRSEKLIELTTEETNTNKMHGGNLKSIQSRGGKRFNDRSAKLIELDDSTEDKEDDSLSTLHKENSSPSRTRQKMHGGNYRNAELDDNIEDDTKPLADITKVGRSKKPRVDAAVLLNSFAQAAPILTTTPTYILDPSKRMYYYVDA